MGTLTFTGTDTTHATARYTVRRMFYYWNVGAINDQIVSATVTAKLRTSDDTNSSTDWRMVVFTDINLKTNWTKRNNNTYYQYPSHSDSYFLNTNYTTFGTILGESNIALNTTGGATNTFTFSTGITNTASSSWSGKNIIVGFFNNNGNYNNDLTWGLNSTATLVLTTGSGSILQYKTDSGWQNVTPYYYTGSAWTPCEVYYHNGSGFVKTSV